MGRGSEPLAPVRVQAKEVEMPALFELGRVVVTSDAHAELSEFGDVDDILRPVVDRHVQGDWGDLDAGDAKMNDLALKSGERILSQYDNVVGGVGLYVITDAAGEGCAACWAGVGECEPEKGSWVGGQHFRDDLPPRRLATTVMRPSDY